MQFDVDRYCAIKIIKLFTIVFIYQTCIIVRRRIMGHPASKIQLVQTGYDPEYLPVHSYSYQCATVRLQQTIINSVRLHTIKQFIKKQHQNISFKNNYSSSANIRQLDHIATRSRPQLKTRKRDHSIDRIFPK